MFVSRVLERGGGAGASLWGHRGGTRGIRASLVSTARHARSRPSSRSRYRRRGASRAPRASRARARARPARAAGSRSGYQKATVEARREKEGGAGRDARREAHLRGGARAPGATGGGRSHRRGSRVRGSSRHRVLRGTARVGRGRFNAHRGPIGSPPGYFPPLSSVTLEVAGAVPTLVYTCLVWTFIHRIRRLKERSVALERRSRGARHAASRLESLPYESLLPPRICASLSPLAPPGVSLLLPPKFAPTNPEESGVPDHRPALWR